MSVSKYMCLRACVRACVRERACEWMVGLINAWIGRWVDGDRADELIDGSNHA